MSSEPLGTFLDEPRGEPQNAAVSDLLIAALRHFQAGKLEEAKQLYLRILAVDARHAWSLYGLGQIAYQCGNAEIATRMMRRAIAANDREPIYHTGLAAVLQSMGNLPEAASEYRRCVELNPKDAGVYGGLGVVLHLMGKLDEAVAEYRRALALRPDDAEMHGNLGAAFRVQGKLEDAAAECSLALSLNPDDAEAHSKLANVLRDQGKLIEADEEFERALGLNPQSVVTLCNRGNLQVQQGKRREARESCDRALALDPDSRVARWNRSLLDLLEGNYAEGWVDYEARCELNVNPPRRFPHPKWRGQPLDGAHILLHSEQGLGDSIQFLRYVPMVQKAGGAVVLDVPRSLRRIAENIPGLAAVTVEGESLPSFDYQCPLMSLPLAFGTTVSSIPHDVPYVTVPQEALRSIADLAWPGEGLRVGLVWSGGPAHPYCAISLQGLSPLLELGKAHFFSLQLGPAAAQISSVRAPIIDLQSKINDMADTAALVSHLDLVITVDTSLAHLAGALGKPTWVLLSYANDWRWLVDREDSPWYPTVRLFRQSRPGDWQPVVERIRVELARLADRPETESGISRSLTA